jgi:hypothetical protein
VLHRTQITPLTPQKFVHPAFCYRLQKSIEYEVGVASNGVASISNFAKSTEYKHLLKKRSRYSDWLQAGRLRGQGSSSGKVKYVIFSIEPAQL